MLIASCSISTTASKKAS